MFTGIIDSIGKVKEITRRGKNLYLVIEPEIENYLSDIKIGSSIAVNGVCLTVIEKKSNLFKVFVSDESLRITNLQFLRINSVVNLEKSMKIDSRFDGHIVLGHIDCIGVCERIFKIQEDYQLELKISGEYLKNVVKKGSIAINGISLTIADISGNILKFAIIPETYKRTNIKELKKGDKLNIEFDIIGKYILSQLELENKITGGKI